MLKHKFEYVRIRTIALESIYILTDVLKISYMHLGDGGNCKFLNSALVLLFCFYLRLTVYFGIIIVCMQGRNNFPALCESGKIRPELGNLAVFILIRDCLLPLEIAQSNHNLSVNQFSFTYWPETMPNIMSSSKLDKQLSILIKKIPKSYREQGQLTRIIFKTFSLFPPCMHMFLQTIKHTLVKTEIIQKSRKGGSLNISSIYIPRKTK